MKLFLLIRGMLNEFKKIKMMKKILVPTDFSLCADEAINFAVQSAKILPLEITLHHAFDLQGTFIQIIWV